MRLNRPPAAALVFDVDSGEVLYRRQAQRVLPIASLTKIMTALLTVAGGAPHEPVRVTPAALAYQGSGIGMLPRGRRPKCPGKPERHIGKA